MWFIRKTSTSGAFHASGAIREKGRWHPEATWHLNVILVDITASLGNTTLSLEYYTVIPASQRHSRITTSFPRRRESSPSADRTVKISPPGPALLCPFCLPGSFSHVIPTYSVPFGLRAMMYVAMHGCPSWIPALAGMSAEAVCLFFLRSPDRE